MDRMPTTAINAAMLADPKPIICREAEIALKSALFTIQGNY